MSNGKEVRPNELNAYLDNELSDDERSAVEARLAESPEEAERLRDYRSLNADLARRYAGVLDEPIPDRMRALVTVPKPSLSRDFWRRIAAAAAIALASGTFGYLLGSLGGNDRPGTLAFVDNALGAHAVFVTEVRHPVEVAANEERHLVRWLTKRLGEEVRVPVLTGLGYRLIGGRLLPDGGRPSAQFMFEDGHGSRLTIYVRRESERPNTAFQFVSQAGLSAFYWIDRPMSYVIIADVPRAKLMKIARVTYDQLE